MAAGVPVALRSSVGVPLAAALPIFEKVVGALTKPESAPDLSIDLARDLKMPFEAQVHVPVQFDASAPQVDDGFNVTLVPAVRRPYYPRFAGILRMAEQRAESSALLLEGSYTVPFGIVGRVLDMTLFRGAARRSLQRFLDHIASIVDRCVHQDEERQARMHTYFRP